MSLAPRLLRSWRAGGRPTIRRKLVKLAKHTDDHVTVVVGNDQTSLHVWFRRGPENKDLNESKRHHIREGKGLDLLDARNVPMPYNDKLELATIPSRDDIMAAIRSVL